MTWAGQEDLINISIYQINTANMAWTNPVKFFTYFNFATGLIMCYRAASLSEKSRPWLSWIERQTTNLDVGSSNLPGRTI
jgi:hypothetical protein